MVVPVAKNCPGKWDRSAKVTMPELSVAVGETYVTTLPPELSGVVSLKFSGQFSMTGGVPSTESDKTGQA